MWTLFSAQDGWWNVASWKSSQTAISIACLKLGIFVVAVFVLVYSCSVLKGPNLGQGIAVYSKGIVECQSTSQN